MASWPVEASVQTTSGESNDPATWPPYKTKRTDMNYDPNKDSILQNMISQYTKLKEMSDELGRLIGQEADPNKKSVLQGLQQKTLDMIKQLRIDIDNLFYQRLNQFKQTTGAVTG